MSTTPKKRNLIRLHPFSPTLLPARRALAILLGCLLIAQAVVPPAFASPFAPARGVKAEASRLALRDAAGSPAQPVAVTAAAAETFGVVLTPLSTAFNGHTGIDYQQQSRSVVVSANYPTGRPNSFELIDGGGTHLPFSNVAGLGGALKIATARDDGQGASLGGFRTGELFSGTGLPGQIARIAPDGATVQNPWVTLQGETGLPGGLHVDRTGVYGGDLVVVTTAGGVWRINSSGAASRVASLNTPLRGVTTIPEDAAKYGPWAGKILAGAPGQGAVYAVDAQSGATSYALGLNPEDIQVVPPQENFFGLDTAEGRLWGAPADAFAGLIGDILVAQESPGTLTRVRWNGTAFETGQLAQVASWGQITFASAGVAEVRAVKQVYDKIAVVRHAPVLNSGRVEGALWQLSAENVALGGTDVITSDLLVPGRPSVSVGNSHPNFGGVLEGVEDSQPTNYSVTIGGNATLRHLITRTNPIKLASVGAPPVPAGARDVSLTSEGQSLGDYSTLRNLSVSGKAGAVSVPPGTYGNFSISGRTALVLGVENATEAAVYNLQGLTLAGGSELRLKGPVVLTVRGDVSLTGSTVGAADNPRRMLLRVAEGSVKVGGGGVLYGVVRAPRGLVEIVGQGRVRGTVMCDRLTVSGGGVLQVTETDVPPPPVNRPPAVDAGTDQVVTLPADTVSLNGAVSDDGLPQGSTLRVKWDTVSGPGPVGFSSAAGAATTATFSAPGVYVLRLTASDGLLTAADTVQIEVVPRNRPPVVNAGPDATVKLPNPVNLNGTVSDDALPRGSSVIVKWSVTNGPGTVSFADDSAAVTTATFGAPGTYTLRLSAGDTELTAFDELVVTVLPSNQPPTADAGPDKTVSLDETLPAPEEFKLRTISTGFNSPIGIDYHPPTGKVIMSVNYNAGGQPFNFETVAADGTHAPFSNIHGLTDELKLATVRDDNNGGTSIGGFQVGELFTGSGVPGVIVRVSPDGSTVQNPWVTLPGESGLMRGSLYVDRTGIYGGDLIVVTTSGGVWRVNSAGQPAKLAQIPTHLEGLSTIPDVPVKYGPWAGKILIGAEDQRRFYAVDAQGHTDSYDIGISPEDIDIIPARENFFGVAFANNTLMGAPASAFSGMVGDLLVAQESGTLFRVHWNGTEFEKTALASVAQWEHVTFAPAGIVEIPPAGASVTLDGTVTDDAAPGFPLSVKWEKVSGPGTVTFNSPNQSVTRAVFNQTGTYVLRLTADDTEFAASDEVTVNVTTPVPPLADAALKLSPEAAGPNVTGTSQTLRAMLLDRHGFPIVGATIHFDVEGANAAGGDAPTNSQGVAEFTYTGDAKGDDKVRGSSSDGALSVESNQATVSWVTPVQRISTTTVLGRFFSSNGSGAFNAQPTQPPVFSQFFPTINFNPPVGTVPGNTSGVNEWTRPFTNVTTDLNGNYTGTIPAQGNGYMAGAAIFVPLHEFNAVFTGSFTVAAPGNVTFNFFSADGFIFGVGGGAVRVGGVLSNPPPSGRTPFEDMPVMGAYNNATAPVANGVTVYFPAAGSYPYEVDYSECCDAQLALTMTTAESGNHGVPPTGSLALSPIAPPAREVGQSQTFNVTATDASGNPMAGARLRLTVSGADTLQLNAAADAAGRASFTYTGGNAGTDSLQVSAPVGATVAYSNVVSMRWNPVNQPPAVNAGPDISLDSASDSAGLAGGVTDDGLPAGAPVTAQWTKLSGPGTVTFANPNAASTSATFSIAGVYVLRLSASDTLLSASDEVVVSVNGVNAAPDVNAGPDVAITLPRAAQLSGAVTDDGLPLGGTPTTITWSVVSGPGAVTFQNPGQATTLASFGAAGVYVLRLTANDSELAASDEVTVTVHAPLPLPSVQLTSPTDGSHLTDRTDIVGSVSGGTWRLEYSLNSGETDRVWTAIASGESAVANGRLGVFDPTLLLNGSYTVRLVAANADGQTSEVSFSTTVTGELKVGIFTVAFSDLGVPVAGIPIVVSRTYDSRDKRKGDFGVGWSLGLRNVRVEKSRPLSGDWEETTTGGVFPTYCLRPTRPATVSVTFPEGTVYDFRMNVTPQCQLFVPVQFADVSLTQLPGDARSQGATLEALDQANDVFFTGPAPGAGDLFGGDTLAPFDPTRFRLTTADGTVYVIDEKAGLQSLRDSNGNTLTVTADGVSHSSGRSITFARDAEGRITRITDPAGNHLSYAYDPRGDLVGVTDRDGRVTHYAYNSTHGLLDVTDPLGRRGVRNDYDAAGRLVGITDEDGKTTRFEFDPNSRQQVITDRKGHATVYEFDARGDVLSVTAADGKVVRATFDTAGNLLTATDQFGNTTGYTYNARGNVLTKTDAQGRVTRFTYNARNELTSLTDANGNTTSADYDAAGNLISTRDALSNTTTITYNATGQVLAYADAAGHTTSFEYDAAGQVAKETDRLGNVSRSTYDAVGNRTSYTDARGNTTRFFFNASGLLTTTVDAAGNTTRNEYDAAGHLAASVDALGHRKEVTSNFRGMPLQTTNPDGTQFRLRYDANGLVEGSSATGGLVPALERDNVDMPTKITVMPGVTLGYEYDAAGRMTSESDPLGNTATYQYNLLDKVSVRTDPLGNPTRLDYDNVGNLIGRSDPLGRSIAFSYDKADRLVRTTLPDGGFYESTYDPLGRETSRRDAAGSVTTYTYDAEGNLLTATQPGGAVTRYEYDAGGNLLSSTDALGRKTSFEYDELDRQVKKSYSDGTAELTTYDDAGEVSSQTDRAGKTTTFDYDSMGRVSLVRYADGATASYTYTPTGKRDTVTDARGVTDFDYDALEHLTGVRYPDGTAVGYAYDLAGNRTSITTPDGTTRYGYDPNGRLVKVTDPRGLVTSYAYDAAGNVVRVGYPNGLATVRTYDLSNQLSSITTADAGGHNVFHEEYTRDAAGRRTKVTQADGSAVEYAYDQRSRLTAETYKDAGGGVLRRLGYTYDAVGNRLTLTDSVTNTTVIYTYNVNNQLISDGANAYAYDANGNTVSKTSPGSTTRYSYDARDRLAQVTQPDGSTVSYGYDADGNRVRETGAAGSVINYVIDPTGGAPRVLAETDGNNRVVAAYTYGLGLISQRRNGTDAFYHHDALGSTRVLTNAGGAVTDRYTYDAFGQLLTSEGATANSFLYTGEQQDVATGLYYLRARYYDPSGGRFTSMDPYCGSPDDPASLHRYAYANNDPVNATDPTGMSSLKEGQDVHRIIGFYYLMTWGDYFVSQKIRKASRAKGFSLLKYLPNGKGAYDRAIWSLNNKKAVAGGGRPDLRHYEAGDVYEIKPLHLVVLAVQEAWDYTQKLNQHEKGSGIPESGSWHLGTDTFPDYICFPYAGQEVDVFAWPIVPPGSVLYWVRPGKPKPQPEQSSNALLYFSAIATGAGLTAGLFAAASTAAPTAAGSLGGTILAVSEAPPLIAAFTGASYATYTGLLGSAMVRETMGGR